MNVYIFFHMNLMFSSVPESMRTELVRRCYTPLLDLAEEGCFPLGIEASGLTLELLHDCCPRWVSRLAGLVRDGACEFIGSGYAQIIGPLNPASVNMHNLRLGNSVYSSLLGVTPRLALVNEQAFSPGLVPLYRAAGYTGIIMEWENARQAHPHWEHHLQAAPQRVAGTRGESMDLLWNHSLPFQQFQRAVHDEVTPEEYLEGLRNRTGTDAALCLYGNDAEIFDFRPGRFCTEPELTGRSEWQTIRDLLCAVRALPGVRPVLPSQALKNTMPQRPALLHLESPAQPVPVKKQAKYNITRWGVTGVDDTGANTLCRRLARHFAACEGKNASDRPDSPAQSGHDSLWKELVYLCSSDFRTHIVPERWQAFRQRLLAFYETHMPHMPAGDALPATCAVPPQRVPAANRLLTLETPHTAITLNRNRGLAVQALRFGGVNTLPAAGTLALGTYDDMALGADFYSGHVTFEMPGEPKATDLVPVVPRITETARTIRVETQISRAPLLLHKSITLYKDTPRADIRYRFGASLPAGSLRLGYITLTPQSYDRRTLRYATHNGGTEPEEHLLYGSSTDHGRAVSFLVSASCAAGMTEGTAEFGDARHGLRITLTGDSAAALCMVTYREASPSFFARIMFSLQEVDDTSRFGNGVRKVIPAPCFSFSITPYNR